MSKTGAPVNFEPMNTFTFNNSIHQIQIENDKKWECSFLGINKPDTEKVHLTYYGKWESFFSCGKFVLLFP